MKIIKSINKLNKEVNFKAKIGFVPTMGSLHDGHLSLIESSKKKTDKTLVSIFVNPSQFNKKKDFSSYPKNISKDIRKLRKARVDYVFIPTVRQIYKKNISMKLKINKKDKVLCAKFRKGHFEGVLAVINQLLKIIKAKYLFLGEKDFQQIYLIKKLIKKRFRTKVIPCKTKRDSHFLAYSSRNLLLNKKQIKLARSIAKINFDFYKLVKNKYSNISNLSNIKSKILRNGVKIEYLEIRNKNNLSKYYNKFNFKIFIAYYINKIRLIDNF